MKIGWYTQFLLLYKMDEKKIRGSGGGKPPLKSKKLIT